MGLGLEIQERLTSSFQTSTRYVTGRLVKKQPSELVEKQPGGLAFPAVLELGPVSTKELEVLQDAVHNTLCYFLKGVEIC